MLNFLKTFIHFCQEKLFQRKLISRHNMQPKTLARREYRGKINVKNSRIRNQLKSRIRIRKKSFWIHNTCVMMNQIFHCQFLKYGAQCRSQCRLFLFICWPKVCIMTEGYSISIYLSWRDWNFLVVEWRILSRLRNYLCGMGRSLSG